MLKGKLKYEDLTDEHFIVDTGQKGVDMRLGLDVAALSYKKLVDQIVAIRGPRTSLRNHVCALARLKPGLTCA